MTNLIPTLKFIGKVAIAVAAVNLVASYFPPLWQAINNPRGLINGQTNG